MQTATSIEAARYLRMIPPSSALGHSLSGMSMFGSRGSGFLMNQRRHHFTPARRAGIITQGTDVARRVISPCRQAACSQEDSGEFFNLTG
jgi:hypothetical protein